MIKKVALFTKHLKDYLLLYSLLAITLGLALGVLFPGFVKTNKVTIKLFITIFVVLMIYPMMINLNFKKIPKIVKKPKPIILALVYNFIITPIISLIFVKLFIHNNPELAVGFMLVMLIPGSSMSLGYTHIVDGDLEVATIGIAVLFILIPFLTPFFVGFLGKSYHIAIPLGTILKAILIALIIPMVLGMITRESIVRTRGNESFQKVKPLFSAVTLSVLILMVTSIFMLQAHSLISKWHLVVNLGIVTLIFLVIMFPLITIVDKLFGLSYKEHMGIVFLSTGKNNGTAIAIALLAFGPMVAIPAAILPIFQIIFSIGYIYLAKRVMRLFNFTSNELIQNIEEKK